MQFGDSKARFGPVSPAKQVMKNVHSLEERVKILHRLVHEGVRDAQGRMRHLAVRLVADCPGVVDRGSGCEIAKIFWFVKANVRYTHDMHGIDTYQSALRTLQFRGGDCDDHSVLLCTLLSSIGFQCGFRIISTQGKTWEHIYTIVGVPKLQPSAVICLDTTVASSFPGWEPPQITHKKDFFPLKLA